MKDFNDKVVVITGAASGIGRAVARAFSKEGARLHLVDIDAEGVKSLAAELSAAAHVVDCAKAKAVQALAEEVFASEGRVDVLCNNAGVVCGGPVEEIPLSDWRWAIDVNLWGVIHGVRAFVPRMLEQGFESHIVNTASMAGLVPFPFVAPYVASKAAVAGLSEALDCELAPKGIRVSALCPGAVKTNVMKSGRLKLPGSWTERITGLIDRRGATPQQAAKDVLAAVRKKRPLQISGATSMLPLWIIKRISQPAYHHLARFLTGRALKK
jgi:NAD(P)-dependent dehydrogenase (short-subunit alcohol dehydrogenase family)